MPDSRAFVSRTALITSGLTFALAFSLATTALSDAQEASSLEGVHAAHDWQHGSGAELEAAYDLSVREALEPLRRMEAIEALTDAGYDCIFGEAHEDYPEPAAQCVRSFATRACQMDWEVFVTAANGRVDEVTGSFVRDCVGDNRDWPRPLHSPIDEQLAPAPD